MNPVQSAASSSFHHAGAASAPAEKPSKYIFVSGVMKKNPAYENFQNQTHQPVSTVARPDLALAIISSTDDVFDASAVQAAHTSQEMKLSESTEASIEIMQDPEYLEKFNVKGLDGGDLLDRLTNYFVRHEVPLGMVNKLLALSEYKLKFIVDDSGSMNDHSDVRNAQGHMMTRWQEAEQRLMKMTEILAFIPSDELSVSFLNRPDEIRLSHTGKTPEQFMREAHTALSSAFRTYPRGTTPSAEKLQQAFQGSSGQNAFYFLTDGVPNSGPGPVEQLILNRRDPQQNPFTFLSCTNQDEDANWMKEIEERAPFTAELDDFAAEKREVLKDQGPALPYSEGMWLVSNLCAAIFPHDLDAMDESVPFTKQTLQNMLGTELTPESYAHYFQHHKARWGASYREFCTAPLAIDIAAVRSHKESLAQGNQPSPQTYGHAVHGGQSTYQQMQSFGAHSAHASQPAYPARPPAYAPGYAGQQPAYPDPYQGRSAHGNSGQSANSSALDKMISKFKRF
ncbi:MAG: hypothetical protein H7315_09330 [Herminiimonas sp.]|nr:hypothetical protein [Herminiimonas sp.]